MNAAFLPIHSENQVSGWCNESTITEYARLFNHSGNKKAILGPPLEEFWKMKHQEEAAAIAKENDSAPT
ncbi:hypothetical protein Fmac_027242 [Flemingia macrophylla]|uniref:Uncharacterized protein n=1 Tax=Flemingia macrophylla TaxID=520843 RepID=A0ABD1LHN2_9FABA